MGSLVLVGRCDLRGDLASTKKRNAVSPIATVMLYLNASSGSFLTPQCFQSFYASCLLHLLSRFVPLGRCPLLAIAQRFVYLTTDPQAVQ